MTSTTDRPIETTPDQDERLHQNRTLKIILLAVTIIAVALGGILINNATTTDDDSSDLPDNVQQVLDDYTAATMNNDYEAFQDLVTEDFLRSEYFADPQDREPYRATATVDTFRRKFQMGLEYTIESVGEPVIVGDGPWFVSIPQTWTKQDAKVYYDNLYTFAIIDDDGTLRVDDAYWTGIGPILIEE